MDNINKKTSYIAIASDTINPAHINLIDNFHYARNIVLPGAINDNYSVKFNIIPPTNMDLALHKDWSLKYGESLINETSFSYNNVNFEEIAKANRK